jgi:hypothetical protein
MSLHLARFEQGRIIPVASRLLPGQHFLDLQLLRPLEPSAMSVVATVFPTLDAPREAVIRFDRYDASPLPGDPQQLLAEWEKKLGLEIDARGRVVSARP